MSKILLVVVGVIVLGGGAYYYFQSSYESGTVEETSSVLEDNSESNEGGAVQANVIVYSDSGFSPAELTVKKGDTVIFRNEVMRDVWPATAIHPSHTVYPGSSIQKCFNEESEKSILFDACEGFGEGEEWSFTFNEVGDWKYHDHLRTAHWGSVIVEE